MAGSLVTVIPWTITYRSGMLGDLVSERDEEDSPIARPKPCIRRGRLDEIRVRIRVAELMTGIGILETFDIEDSFICQSESRSFDLKVEVPDHVVHPLPEVSGE